MYDPQIGDAWVSPSGKNVKIVQSDPLNNKVQVEYESGRSRWIDVPDLLTKYTFVA